MCGDGLRCSEKDIKKCPDTFAGGRSENFMYAPVHQDDWKAPCLERTSCVTTFVETCKSIGHMNGKAFTAVASEDYLPKGEDGNHARISTKGNLWHPRGLATHFLALGMKRIVCHDNKCDTWRKVLCIRTDGASRCNRLFAGQCLHHHIHAHDRIAASRDCTQP